MASPLPVTSTPARWVSVGVIERELEALWRAAAGDVDPKHPVFRACMSNLLVLCRTDAEAAAVMTELPEVVAVHPARALALVADERGETAPLDAYVAAHCHLREGTRVCGESVTLTARGEAVRRLPATARALLVGDLPTSLWWATPEAPALGGPLFSELASMANQVIFDSLGWLEPVRGMTAMARLEDDGPLLMDVCWRRLRGWRRILSQGLDPSFAPGVIETLDSVVLEHGPHALTQAWLVVGWLACHLGWRPESGKVAGGTEVTWRFESARGPVRVTVRRLPEGPPEIRSLSVVSAPGGVPSLLSFESEEGGRLSARSDVPTAGRTLTLPIPSRAAMVARQLSDLEPDPLFRRTLAFATAMASSLAH